MDETTRRKALGMVPYGVYVVGVGRGASVGAFTATWVSQASFDPPLLMLGIRRDARQHERIEAEKVLSVNFLAGDQKKLASHFIRWHEPVQGTFGGVPFHPGVTGAPLLTEAAAWVDCRVRRIVPAGDHDVVVAEVVDAGVRRDAAPLSLHDTGWSYGG